MQAEQTRFRHSIACPPGENSQQDGVGSRGEREEHVVIGTVAKKVSEGLTGSQSGKIDTYSERLVLRQATQGDAKNAG